MNKKLNSLIFLILVVLVIFSIVTGTIVIKNSQERDDYFTPHVSVISTPILIDTNSALDTFCFGSGTDGQSWNTAHIIENYEIDGDKWFVSLKIKNTDRFLIIRNCTFWNALAGLQLENCTNVRVSNCVVRDNQKGIALINSHHNFISDNIAKLNKIFGLSF